MQRRFRTIGAYITREFLLSFMVMFLFFFVIFFINQILLLAEGILSKKAPLLDVVLLMFYAIPFILAMSFPFAALVGGLMASGRLSSDNEILVMMASGVSEKRIFAPFLLLGILISVVSLITNDVLLPLGSVNYTKLSRKLILSTPALELTPFSVKTYGEGTIITGAGDGKALTDVVIMDTVEGTKSRVITAARAWIVENTAEAAMITLGLERVFVHAYDFSKPNRYEYSRADRMEYNILLKNFTDSVRSISPQQMSSTDLRISIEKKRVLLDDRISKNKAVFMNRKGELAELYAAMYSRGERLEIALRTMGPMLGELKTSGIMPSADRELNIYTLEYYKKFSIPFSGLCFVLLAFPAGLVAKKSGRALGFGIGLIVAVIYWGMLFVGQNLGMQAGFSPFWSMWLPNIFIVASGLALFIIRRLSR